MGLRIIYGLSLGEGHKVSREGGIDPTLHGVMVHCGFLKNLRGTWSE